MTIRRSLLRVSLATLALAFAGSNALAGQFNGTLYYTNYNGGANVNKVDYTYNDSTHSLNLTNKANVAHTPGADGIIFAPNGKLLIGGQGSNLYEVNPTNGSYTTASTNGNQAYHESLDPSGTSVWTSPFGGPAINIALSSFGTLTPASVHNITGGDRGITTLIFTPGGKTFYINGAPNDGGNFGTINMSTFVTTQLEARISGAHGGLYDSFSNTILIDGGSNIRQYNATTGAFLSNLRFGSNDDQISVDGFGHLFAAESGAGAVGFVDYSTTGIIGTPAYTTSVGGFNGIDDLAPLSGLGSVGTPEPSSLVVGCIGVIAALGYGIRRKKTATV